MYLSFQIYQSYIMIKPAQNIRKIRELKNIKQAYMATQLNMTQQDYSKIEMGEIAVSQERLEKIATILEVSPQDILNFDDRAIFNNNHFTVETEGTGNYACIINDKTLLDDLKQQYEARIEDLQKQLAGKDKEIERLHQLLVKALNE